jgi:hypothetical protein
MEASVIAESRWIRIIANQNVGAYEVFKAEAQMADPVWPDLTFQQILEIAFKDRLINDLDHQIIRRLKGLE